LTTGLDVSAHTSHISLPLHPAQSQPQGCVLVPYPSSMLVRRHAHQEPCRTCSAMHRSRRHASLPFTPSRMYALLLRRCCCSMGKHVSFACMQWWAWLFWRRCSAGMPFMRTYATMHARMHVCLSVSNTADNPASHSIAKEQFRTICHESGAQWPQQSPCVWIMSIAGVGSLRAAVVSSR